MQLGSSHLSQTESPVSLYGTNLLVLMYSADPKFGRDSSHAFCKFVVILFFL